MANEMLKFRKGTFAQINAAAKVPGTIYIAKDEKAMYVDIDTTENGRIRIGDFIRVETVEGITPPYSTSALYYVEADNALLKYTGEGKGKGWKQVNGTDDLKASITTLQNDVSALKGTVGSVNSGLVKDMADAKAAIAANTSAIGVASGDGVEASGLHALIEANADDIDAAELRIKALEDTVGTNEEGETIGGRVIALEGDMSKAKSDISTLQTESAKHVEKTYVDETFVTKAVADPILAKVDTANGVTAAIEAAVAGEKSRAEAAEKALDDSIKAVKQTADGAVQSTAFETWKTENTAAIGTAKAEAIEAAEDYADGKITEEVNRADGKYATKLALESTDGIVSGHTASLATLNGTAETAGSVNWAKAAADAAMAKANEKTTMAEVEAKDYATKTEAKGYADAKDAAITAAQNTANAADAKGQQGIDDAAAALAEAQKKTTMADVEAKGYATDANAQKYAKDVQGNTTSTVKDAMDAAAAATQAAQAADAKGAQGISDAAAAKSAAEAAQATADAAVTKESFESFKSTNSTAIADAKKAGTDAASAASANAQSIQTLQGAVNTLNGDAQTTGSVAKAVADAEGRLNTEIANKINAANAMDYLGGVSSESELLIKDEVKMGDTYVATQKFTLDGDTVYPGDLVIAQGTEENGVIADPTWDIVHTGYDASLEQTITTSADGKLQLTSAVGANNGQITFASTGSASVAVENNTVTVGMVWEDF